MKNLLIIGVLCFCTILSAQENSNEIKTKGYQNYTSYNLLIGSQQDYNTYIHSLQMDHNYLATKYFAVGLTTGIEWMDINMASIGPNIKFFYPGKNNSSLYTSISYGPDIPIEKEKDDWWYTVKEINGKNFMIADLGYSFPTHNHLAIFIALGYRYQAYSYTLNEWWIDTVERKITYNRFAVKVGIRIF